MVRRRAHAARLSRWHVTGSRLGATDGIARVRHAETNADGVFVSCFGNDLLMYCRTAWDFAPIESLGNFRAQLY
jgi:hypothetical protein